MEEEEIVQPSNAENEDSFIRVKGADEEEESLGSNAFMRKSSRKRAISKFLSGVATNAIFSLNFRKKNHDTGFQDTVKNDYNASIGCVFVENTLFDNDS